jgi:L-malate glycosyltransferase
MSYTLGMTGPISVADFREFIDPAQWRDDLPKGQGGTPVNLLCRELLKRGQKLVVFSCDSAVKEEIVLQGDNLRLCLGPKGVRPARNFFKVEREYLQRAIAREKPDVIHAQWTYEYAMPVQRSGIPHVITAHDAPINILRHNFIPYRIARTLMAYWVLSRAKRVISVSPYVADHLHRFMFYYGHKEVIPNGIPEHQFRPPKGNQYAKEKITFATILPGWAGLKNGQNAVKAFALHRKKRANDRLIMFGHGHGVGEAAEQWAMANGLADNIIFAGHTPYLHVITALAEEVDVLIHPSLEEAQPMVLIEAMALSIPVIGGCKSGGTPWTLDDGKAGKLVNIKQPSLIAAAMLELANSAEQREEWALKGYRHAVKKFNIDVIASKYTEIYSELASQRLNKL